MSLPCPCFPIPRYCVHRRWWWWIFLHNWVFQLWKWKEVQVHCTSRGKEVQSEREREKHLNKNPTDATALATGEDDGSIALLAPQGNSYNVLATQQPPSTSIPHKSPQNLTNYISAQTTTLLLPNTPPLLLATETSFRDSLTKSLPPLGSLDEVIDSSVGGSLHQAPLASATSPPIDPIPDEIFIAFSEEEYSTLNQPWAHSVICKIIRRSFDAKFLKDSIQRVWKVKKPL